MSALPTAFASLGIVLAIAACVIALIVAGNHQRPARRAPDSFADLDRALARTLTRRH